MSAPIVRDPRPMDQRLFRIEPMGLRDDLLRLPFDDRFRYEPEQNILFLNFEQLEMKSIESVEARACPASLHPGRRRDLSPRRGTRHGSLNPPVPTPVY